MFETAAGTALPPELLAAELSLAEPPLAISPWIMLISARKELMISAVELLEELEPEAPPPPPPPPDGGAAVLVLELALPAWAVCSTASTCDDKAAADPPALTALLEPWLPELAEPELVEDETTPLSTALPASRLA